MHLNSRLRKKSGNFIWVSWREQISL